MQQWLQPTYQLVESKDQLLSLCKVLKQASNDKQIICVDIETTSVFSEGKGALDNFHGWILGISFCVNKEEGFYIPLAHTENEIKRPNQLSLRAVREHLNPILSVKNVFLAHNSKFDYKGLLRAGIELFPSFWDTQIALKIINGDAFKSTALKRVVKEYIDAPPAVSFEEAAGGNAAEVDPSEFCVYAINDVLFTFYLYEELKPIIDSKYHKLFYEIEAPLIPILAQKELKGIRIDPNYFTKIKKPLNKCKNKIEKYFQDKYGISITSNDQLREILKPLCEGIQMPYTDTGAMATGVDALKLVMRKTDKKDDAFFIAKHVLKHRGINKALTTYIDKFPSISQQHYGDERIDTLHTTFNQIINSGRLSSKPNVQNIPKDTELISVRRGFIPRKGYVFVEADWASCEYRIIAVASQDKKLLDAYLNDPRTDFHMLTAISLFGKEGMTPEKRKKAKSFNFAKAYGATAHGVARALGCSLEDAQDFIDTNEAFFEGVTKWKKVEEQNICKNRYSETFWGRRRYMSSDIHPQMDKRYRYEAAIRELINHIIQGTSADLLKWSMVNITKQLAEKNLDAHILTSTHDSIVTEAKREIAEEVAEIVRSTMEVKIKGIELPIDLEIKESFAKS